MSYIYGLPSCQVCDYATQSLISSHVLQVDLIVKSLILSLELNINKIPGILPGEVLQWYLICTLVDLIFILLVDTFYTTLLAPC